MGYPPILMLLLAACNGAAPDPEIAEKAVAAERYREVPRRICQASGSRFLIVDFVGFGDCIKCGWSIASLAEVLRARGATVSTVGYVRCARDIELSVFPAKDGYDTIVRDDGEVHRALAIREDTRVLIVDSTGHQMEALSHLPEGEEILRIAERVTSGAR